MVDLCKDVFWTSAREQNPDTTSVHLSHYESLASRTGDLSSTLGGSSSERPPAFFAATLDIYGTDVF
jgi:hypothetical protein